MTRIFHISLTFSFIIFLQANYLAQTRGEIEFKNIIVKCIGKTYKLSPNQTYGYPSQTHYMIDKSVYELKIILKLNGNNFTYNKPLAITCYLPEGGRKTLIVNQELDTLSTDRYFEYVMILKTSEKGWAKMTIGEWDDYNLSINFLNGILHYDYSFRLE